MFKTKEVGSFSRRNGTRQMVRVEYWHGEIDPFRLIVMDDQNEGMIIPMSASGFRQMLADAGIFLTENDPNRR